MFSIGYCERLISTLYGVLSYKNVASANNEPALCDHICIYPSIYPNMKVHPPFGIAVLLSNLSCGNL